MKKQLIAAAVAGLIAAPAMAQVTVYGILDLGYSSLSKDVDGVTTDTSVINAPASGLSSSRLGFRGTEDLGAGLKAEFVFETGLKTDGSSFAGGDRAANVALSGSFGTIRVGRQNTPGKTINDTYTAFGGGASYEQGAAAFEATRNNSGLSNSTARALKPTVDRASQAVSYTSPTMGGLTVVGALIENQTEVAAGDSGTSGYSLAGGFDGGAFKAHVGYTSLETKASATSLIADHTMTQVGASYAMGPVTLFGLYNSGEYTAATAGAPTLESWGADVGVKYALDSNVVLVGSVGQGESEVSGSVLEFSGVQAQVHYLLSKRTTVYAMYGKTDYDTAKSNSDSVVMIGVRHSF